MMNKIMDEDKYNKIVNNALEYEESKDEVLLELCVLVDKIYNYLGIDYEHISTGKDYILSIPYLKECLLKKLEENFSFEINDSSLLPPYVMSKIQLFNEDVNNKVALVSLASEKKKF